MPVKILFCGTGWLPIVDVIAERLPASFRSPSAAPGDSATTAQSPTVEIWNRERPLVDTVGDFDVILPSNAVITADVIAAARDLMLIQQPAAGVDGIDLEAAKARGVPVCNAPGANRISVAETALFLMLALAHRFGEARKCFAHRRLGVPLSIELCGKTLGIIGLGNSGQALAERARGLGMRVLSVRRKSPPGDLATLLAESDVISLHCPLTTETAGMIDEAAFAAMKPGALLVNCARGGLVDRAALDAALDAGALGGVGLDTYWQEPWDPDDPLYNRDNVVVLPHVAGSSEESFARIAEIVCDNIARVARGQPPMHQVV